MNKICFKTFIGLFIGLNLIPVINIVYSRYFLILRGLYFYMALSFFVTIISIIASYAYKRFNLSYKPVCFTVLVIDIACFILLLVSRPPCMVHNSIYYKNYEKLKSFENLDKSCHILKRPIDLACALKDQRAIDIIKSKTSAELPNGCL